MDLGDEGNSSASSEGLPFFFTCMSLNPTHIPQRLVLFLCLGVWAFLCSVEGVDLSGMEDGGTDTGRRMEGCCPASGNSSVTVASPFFHIYDAQCQSVHLLLIHPSILISLCHLHLSAPEPGGLGRLKGKLKTLIKVSVVQFIHSYFLSLSLLLFLLKYYLCHMFKNPNAHTITHSVLSH